MSDNFLKGHRNPSRSKTPTKRAKTPLKSHLHFTNCLFLQLNFGDKCKFAVPSPKPLSSRHLRSSHRRCKPYGVGQAFCIAGKCEKLWASVSNGCAFCPGVSLKFCVWVNPYSFPPLSLQAFSRCMSKSRAAHLGSSGGRQLQVVSFKFAPQ